MKPVAATNPNPTQTLWLYGTDAVSQDVYIDATNPNTNENANTNGIVLGKMGAAACSTPNFCDALIQLNLSKVPLAATIVSATLYYYMWGTLSPATGTSLNFWFGNITSSWDETTVTYNTRPSEFQYSAGPTAFPGSVSTAEIGTFVPFTITSLFQAWYNGSVANHGLELDYNFASGNLAVTFVPKEALFPDLRPQLQIIYQLPSATVYPAYYCSGGPCELNVFSGSGLAPWLFNVSASENNGTFYRVNPETIGTNLSTYLTVKVTDFFGNSLVAQSSMVTTTPFYMNVAIPYRLLQLFNERTEISSISIVPGSGTPIALDVMPGQLWSAPLKSGISYTITINLKDRDQNVIGTVTIVRTLTSATSYIINGTNLQEVITDLNGLTTTVHDLSSLVQPGILVNGNLPFVPAQFGPMSGDLLNPNGAIAIDPYQTLTYLVNRTGSGTNFIVGPVWNAGATVVTLLQDYILLSGSWTHLWINSTQNTTSTADDTPILSTASALTYLGLAGQNLSVQVAGSTGITVDRLAQVKVVNTFSWTQDLQTLQFSYSPQIANRLNVSWTNVQDYISYVPGHAADPSTIVVKDVTNNAILNPGVNYIVTSSGIALELSSVGASATRSFGITYNQTVNDTSILEPACSPGNPTGGTFAGQDYVAVVVTCTNQNTFDYIGPLHFSMSTATQPIDQATAIVVQGNLAGTQILPSRVSWTYGNTLTVSGQVVKARTQATYTVYFHFAAQTFSPAFFQQQAPLIAIAFGISTVLSGAIAWNVRDKPDSDLVKRRRNIAQVWFIASIVILVVVVLLAFVW